MLPPGHLWSRFVAMTDQCYKIPVMDQIGTSHIATADLLICGFTVFLIVFLQKSAANSVWARVWASLSGAAIFAAIGVIIFADLHRDAVSELSFIAFALCWNLWEWNSRRVKSKVTHTVPASNVTN
jgi:hypothetical protein